MTDEHDRYRAWSGAYVLGALDPAERTAFEEHLAGCDRCRGDVQAFAPLPGLLAKVDAEGLEAAGTSTAVDDAAAARVTRLASDRAHVERAAMRRSLRRWRVTAAAAATAAAVAVGTLVLPGRAPEPGRDLQVTAAAADTTGSVAVAERGWGTHVEVDVTGLPARERYLLRAVAADGSEQTAATWGATPRGRALLTGATAIQLADLDRLVITSDDPDDVLATASTRG